MPGSLSGRYPSHPAPSRACRPAGAHCLGNLTAPCHTKADDGCAPAVTLPWCFCQGAATSHCAELLLAGFCTTVFVTLRRVHVPYGTVATPGPEPEQQPFVGKSQHPKVACKDRRGQPPLHGCPSDRPRWLFFQAGSASGQSPAHQVNDSSTSRSANCWPFWRQRPKKV